MTEATPTPIILPAAGDETTVAEFTPGRLSAWWVWLACLALAVLAVEPALRDTGFIWTDKSLVPNNSFLNRLAGLAMLWTGGITPSTYPLPQYSPLTQTTFFLERMIWGDTAWGYRLTSALLHATTGLVLYHLLRGIRLRGAAVIAVLFVAHPLTIESVALLTERRNVIAALLGLSAAYLALRASGVIAAPPAEARFKPLPPEPGRLLALAAIVQVIALFASPSIAFLPGVVLLICWWRRRRVYTRLIGVCAGLMVAGVAMTILNGAVERSAIAGPASQWRRDITPMGDAVTRVQLASRAAATYVLKFVAPYPLSVDYDRPMTPADAATLAARGGAALTAGGTDVGPNAMPAWLPPILIAGLLFAAWNYRDRMGRSPFVAGAAFLLVLLPSLGFVSLGWMRYSFVADRAGYLATAVLMAGVVAGIAGLLRTRALANAAFGLFVLAMLAVVVLSRIAADRFREESNFWRDTLATNPRSLLALEQSITLELNGSTPDYVSINRRIADGLKTRPREPSLLVLNARTLAEGAGEGEQAVALLRSAIQIESEYAPFYSRAGELLRRIAYAQPNDLDVRKASKLLFLRATELDPKDAYQRLRVAEANSVMLRRMAPDDPQTQAIFDETLLMIDEATALQPFHVNNLISAARLLLPLGKVSDASTRLDVARAIDPDNAEIYTLLGEAYMAANVPDTAEIALGRALELDPRSVPALVRLGALRQRQERWDAAREALNSAITLNANSAEANARLADVNAQRQTVWPPAASTTMPSSQPATAPALGPTP